MRRTRLAPISKKRMAENKIYLKKRHEFFILHPYCQFWLAENGYAEPGKYDQWALKLNGNETIHVDQIPRATDIHHRKHRGKFLLDESSWLGVTREAHRFIHDNPRYAYEKGYLIR